MTDQEKQVNPTENVKEDKANDKELNFRALEAKYQRQMEMQQKELQKYQQEVDQMREQMMRTQQDDPEEEDDSDPYIDRKRLKKELGKTTQQLKKESQAEIRSAINQALSEERQNMWLKANPDFYDVMKLADKLAEKDPELAETILQMPEGFERQKLVYRNIKSMNLHNPNAGKENVQDKIDANRRSPYYQPSGIANSPHVTGGDFSPQGQKQAYEKLQELKSRLRL